MRGYKFSYDNCNRLTNSIYAEREDMSYHLNRYNEEIVTYNANGAIKKIRRRGRKDDGIYGKSMTLQSIFMVINLCLL